VNLLILSRIYFYLFWFTLLCLIFVFQSTIWPFFLAGIPSPNLFLNSLILLALLVNKPNLFTFVIAAFIYSAGSSFGFGYYLASFVTLFMAILFIRSQTFFLNEKSLYWIVSALHILAHFTVELIFMFWANKPLHFPFFDFILMIALSVLAFPFQRYLFKSLLTIWRNSKWGEVGHE